MGAPSTRSESHYVGQGQSRPVPGVLLVFAGNAPQFRAIRVAPGPLNIGREDIGGIPGPDEQMSRQHAQLTFDGPGWSVRDLGSKHGTFVDGQRIEGEWRGSKTSVLRCAHTIFLFCDDIRRFEGANVTLDDELVVGPTLKTVLDDIALFGRRDVDLLVTGETGTGKELAARTFHDGGGKGGPFVSVNCATIVGSMAERQLFGTEKGAYTDAKAEADGFVQAAKGGTLVLDELGELSPEVQAKLLRMIENREVYRLGSSRPEKVSLKLCASTNRDLHAAVEAKEFRADLYYRLAGNHVTLPPLRARREDIAYLVASTLAKQQVRTAHSTLIEATLLRWWPGNVRELRAAVVKAAATAHGAGDKKVRAEHLDARAGVRGNGAEVRASKEAPSAPTQAQPTKEEVVRALEAASGNQSAAQRALGIPHRNTFTRLLDKYGLRGAKTADDGDDA